MRRQPKARSVKAAARVRQFYELTAVARDVPQAETRVDFEGGVGMHRQVRACAGRRVSSHDLSKVVCGGWYVQKSDV